MGMKRLKKIKKKLSKVLGINKIFLKKGRVVRRIRKGQVEIRFKVGDDVGMDLWWGFKLIDTTKWEPNGCVILKGLRRQSHAEGSIREGGDQLERTHVEMEIKISCGYRIQCERVPHAWHKAWTKHLREKEKRKTRLFYIKVETRRRALTLTSSHYFWVKIGNFQLLKTQTNNNSKKERKKERKREREKERNKTNQHPPKKKTSILFFIFKDLILLGFFFFFFFFSEIPKTEYHKVSYTWRVPAEERKEG